MDQKLLPRNLMGQSCFKSRSKIEVFVHTTKKGFCKYIIGLRFGHVDEGTCNMLSKTTHEARFGKSQRTFCGVTQAFTIEN
jgi:hypothetical protein